MESFDIYKSRLFDAIHRDLNSFDSKLQEELSLRDHAFKAERQKLQEEIHVLQQEALRTKELEIENLQLRSKLKAVQQDLLAISSTESKPDTDSSKHQVQFRNNEHATQTNHSNGLGTNENELVQLRKQLTNITRSCRKAVFANGVIQDKYRQLRQQYNKDIHKLQEKNINTTQPDRPRDQSNLRKERANSACPTLSSSIFLLNDTPDPVLPHGILPEDLQSHSLHEGSSWDTRVRNGSSIEIKTSTAQDVLDRSSGAGQESAAETSDESPTQPRLVASPKYADGKTMIEDTRPPIKPEDEDSDSPVVVKERSLKRKRSPNFQKITSDEIKKTKIPHGSTVKPIHIKSDPGSSSPTINIAPQGFTGLHDSLDLDEIEERHMTPRKRRGFLDQTRSSSRDILPTVTGHGMNQSNRLAKGNDENSNYQINPWHENEVEVRSVRDEAFYKKKGEEYAARLMEEELRNGFHLRARVEPNKELPPWLLRNKYAKAARQYSHNQKSHERRERMLNLPQETPGTDSKNSYRAKMTSTSNPTECLQTETREKDVRLSNSTASDESREPMFTSGAKSRPSKAPFDTPSALKPLDVNNHILPRTSSLSKNQTRNRFRKPGDHGAAHISHLAEDGETFNPKIRKETSVGDTNEEAIENSRAPDLFNRLSALLSPSKPPLVGEPSTKLTKSAAIIETLPNTPSVQIYNKGLPTPDSMQNRAPGTSRAKARSDKPSMPNSKKWKPSPSNLAATDEPEEVLPEHEPLRCRPIHSLRPEDFKLNPSRNQGYTHAFNEVVRNRDQRKCMPGCTRPDCCGNALRRAVQIGGYTNPRKNPNTKAPQDQDQDQDQDQQEDEAQNNRLLIEYLGDDIARLKDMSPASRQELLLKAQTEHFANRVGKHRRHAYGRGSTPPGFWDTDMPSTQQAQEYRAAAAVMEQEKVRDMYREAMRPEGRFRFRDE